MKLKNELNRQYVNNCNCYEFDALASEKTSDPSSPFKNSEIKIFFIEKISG